MRYMVSREEMQEIDRYSIEKIGIPGIVLMERAALSMKEVIVDRFPQKKNVLIVVERGNNGGDGLALARLLEAVGYQITVFEIGGVKTASESYKLQYDILMHLDIEIVHQMPKQEYDLIIDAIFGVGLKRPVIGAQKEAIEELNQKKGIKVAVDVPSGVDASNGQVQGIGFYADLTLTFGFMKIGLVLYPGASYVGEVIVSEIGFPKKAVEAISPEAFYYDLEDLRRIPPRNPWSHKGTYGKVLLIAGSKNMAGAAYLAAKAAYRSGSGLVRIFTCEENRTILQEKLPEAILTTYQSEEEAVCQLEEALEWATVIGIGPGIGRSLLAVRLVEAVLEKGKVPLVMDADAINILSDFKNDQLERSAAFDAYPAGIILTPHLMEMSRFTGEDLGYIKTHLLEIAEKEAREDKIIVLKDSHTIVSDGSRKAYINMSGNNGMSVGGSGDVLTGIICGLTAGGTPLADAARLGVYCHGLAGDRAAEEKGYHGLLAGDIADYLCKVLS